MWDTIPLGTLFGLPSVLIYVFTDGRSIILKQPLLSHRMPICHIGVARSVGFEPTSRTFVGWHTIHCANRVCQVDWLSLSL